MYDSEDAAFAAYRGAIFVIGEIMRERFIEEEK
jgi:hypothetical protein